MPLPWPFLINFIYLAWHSAERKPNFVDCLYVACVHKYKNIYAALNALLASKSHL